MRVTVLHNPSSGYGRRSKDELLDLLCENGHAPTYWKMDDDFEEAFDDPGDLLAVAGGDGTVGRVAKALARREGEAPPLAPLPLGTANNTARCYG